jgi:hypothetical protein
MNKTILFLILLVACFINATADDFPRTLPDENDRPVKVFVSFYVTDIEGIDNKDQSFTLDVIIRLKWKDERLAEAKTPLPLNSIWNPNVQIYNLRDVETRFPKVAVVLNDGFVQYTQRYYATLSSRLNFKEFPFDVQTLPITLLSFGFSPDEVELVFETAGGAKEFSISDWHVEPVGSESSEFKANLFGDASEDIVRPRLDYKFKASRYIHFYWWKVLAPLMVILFLSWAVFWIDPSQVGAQIGVSGTSILTLIAFLYKLDNILPPVSYLTRMDHFIFTSLILVFIAYLEALISTTFALKGNKELASKLDITFRIIYPVIFIIIVLVFWVK